MTHVTTPHNEAFVVTTEIDEFNTRRILVDRGRLTNILSLNAFESMDVSKKDLKKVD